MLKRIVALLLVITTALAIPAQANAGILRNGAAAGIVVGGARLAQVISKIAPLAMLALRAEMSGGGRQLTAGLQSALDEHKVLGPKVLIEALARSVARDFSLHGRAVEIVQQTGLKVEALFREEEREIAKILPKILGHQQQNSPEDDNRCHKENKAPYDPRKFEDLIRNKYGHGNTESHTLPELKMPNVRASLEGLKINGIPFDTRGMPIFGKHVVADVNIARSLPNFIFEDRGAHMRHATRELHRAINAGQFKGIFSPEQIGQIKAGVERVQGYVWHHHADLGRMQLVPKDIHQSVPHSGGFSLWKKCR